MIELDYLEIVLRISISIIFSSIIGYERESKGHDAGLRTHILVCLGATLITLIQVEATYSILQIGLEHSDTAQMLNTDITRMIAQIVSGIGFLGAGTIIVTKKSVTGLTTAASIWTIAGLGIAIGMGYYFLSFVGCIAIFLVLRIIKRLFRFQSSKRLEIYYIHRKETKNYLNDYFKKRNISILNVDYSIDSREEGNTVYMNLYSLSMPTETTFTQIIDDLSLYDNIVSLRTLQEA